MDDAPLTSTLDESHDPQTPTRPDYTRICSLLHSRFSHDPPRGYVVGKTRMRDLLVSELGVQVSQAERIIDRLEQRGALTYEGSSERVDSRRDTWRIDDSGTRRAV